MGSDLQRYSLWTNWIDVSTVAHGIHFILHQVSSTGQCRRFEELHGLLKLIIFFICFVEITVPVPLNNWATFLCSKSLRFFSGKGILLFWVESIVHHSTGCTEMYTLSLQKNITGVSVPMIKVLEISIFCCPWLLVWSTVTRRFLVSCTPRTLRLYFS